MSSKKRDIKRRLAIIMTFAYIIAAQSGIDAAAGAGIIPYSSSGMYTAADADKMQYQPSSGPSSSRASAIYAYTVTIDAALIGASQGVAAYAQSALRNADAFESQPGGGFIMPVAFSAPRSPAEEFYNMRLRFFLPDTEPLIKETFGEKLRFEEGAFWEYESYYSHAVSFATNLPTLAKIEYGPDASYGYETQQTESYFYQHLLHITGLEPGAIYHYCIKTMGSDGRYLSSGDREFKTLALTPDVVRIPEDLPVKTPPHKLTGDGKKYLLTRDIDAPNGGIVLGGNNVELDLGGHTVTYDCAPNPKKYADKAGGTAYMYDEDASFGVRCALWNLSDQKLFNGKIMQGANGGAGFAGWGYNPVMFTHSDRTEIAGVAVGYYGDSVNGLCADKNVNIHHNIIDDHGSVIDDRHMQNRAVALGGGKNVISYNSVRRCRQTGISGGSECFSNEVYGDSFTTNSFLMDYSSGCKIYNNKIFGLGYNPIGIGGGACNDASATGNFIYMQAYAPTKRYSEYDRLSGAAAFRWQIYNDGEYKGVDWDGNVFADNVVVAKAWPGAAYVRALWVSQSCHAHGTRITGNTIKVEAMADDIDFNDFNYCFTCLDVNSSDASLQAEGFDTRNFEPTPELYVADNRLITNVSFIVSGTGYGIGSNTHYYRNSFEKIDSHDDGFTPIRLGFWYWSALNNKLIDSVEGPGVDLSLPPKNQGSAEGHIRFDIGVTSNRIFADASTGAPLAGVTVSWGTGSLRNGPAPGENAGGAAPRGANSGGREIFGSFATGADGSARTEWVTIINEHKPGEPGASITQTKIETVTFTVENYAPITKNIRDIQGEGDPILFYAL